ncbi:MAG: hypothetical protein WCH43_09655, partial [Verrucomicrobiota bacterium]
SFAAIPKILQSGYKYAYWADPQSGFADLSHASTAIFSGTTAAASSTNVSGVPAGSWIIIKVAWTGAAGAAQTISTNLTPAAAGANWWLSENDADNLKTTAGNNLTSPVYNDTSITADGAFSNVKPGTLGYSETGLTDHVVGVAPFVFVKSSGAPSASSATGVTLTTGSGNTTATVSGTTGIVVGSVLSGTSTAIPQNTYVTAVNSSTSITLSAAPTASVAVSENFTYNGITNITPKQYQLIQNPGLPLSFFTGSPNDAGTTIVPFGRDENAGQRVNAFAETGYGIFTPTNNYQPTYDFSSNKVTSIKVITKGSGYTSAPTVSFTYPGTGSGVTATANLTGNQVTSITVTGSGSNISVAPLVVFSGGGGSGATASAAVGGAIITDISLWPASTVNGTSYPVGDSGWAYGTDEAFALNTPVQAGGPASIGAPVYFVGFLTPGDAASVNSGNNTLTYNGVPYTTANVQNGTYTFWSYEHLYRHTSATGIAASFVDGLALQVYTQDSFDASLLPKTIQVQSLQVGRAVEGGQVSYGNTFTSFH